jgi:hypothetical protein
MIKKRLSAGCGNVPLLGYTNIDKYYFPGSTRPLNDNVLASTWNQAHPESPWLYGDMVHLEFPDETFDEVMVVHALEHVSMEEGNLTIKEASRVCKKGGIVEIEVPDLFIACQMLPNLEVESPPWYRIMGCIYGTTGMDGEGQFHLCGYSVKHLKFKMEQHNLINVIQIPVGFGHGNNQAGFPEPKFDFRLKGEKT